MLDSKIKKKFDSARQILVGKIPSPTAQIEQITFAMIIKFIEDTELNSILNSFIPQFYTNQLPPPLILVSHLPNNSKIIEKAFYLEHKIKTKILCPLKGENKKAIKMGRFLGASPSNHSFYVKKVRNSILWMVCGRIF